MVDFILLSFQVVVCVRVVVVVFVVVVVAFFILLTYSPQYACVFIFYTKSRYRRGMRYAEVAKTLNTVGARMFLIRDKTIF